MGQRRPEPTELCGQSERAKRPGPESLVLSPQLAHSGAHTRLAELQRDTLASAPPMFVKKMFGGCSRVKAMPHDGSSNYLKEAWAPHCSLQYHMSPDGCRVPLTFSLAPQL